MMTLLLTCSSGTGTPGWGTCSFTLSWLGKCHREWLERRCAVGLMGHVCYRHSEGTRRLEGKALRPRGW